MLLPSSLKRGQVKTQRVKRCVGHEKSDDGQEEVRAPACEAGLPLWPHCQGHSFFGEMRTLQSESLWPLFGQSKTNNTLTKSLFLLFLLCFWMCFLFVDPCRGSPELLRLGRLPTPCETWELPKSCQGAEWRRVESGIIIKKIKTRAIRRYSTWFPLKLG